MSEFLDILTHGRRLQGAVKELSINELEAIQEKLGSIIEKRKEKAQALEKAEQEKREKLAAIKKQMEEAGLNVEDLKALSLQPNKKTGKKRPVKYKLVDEQGNEHLWTGIGRMPRVYKDALDSGKSLDTFSVN
ncbi:H-NS histone family protein [Alteromonas sp. McT4-15]|jgi:DNA-binding protein H-NS|uniref:H-NS histone family protein n=1 Tax=unclassified Alteromonas TaxID=2614992 RepID=UPI0019240059|nr:MULTISPECIES: H-NS family nucleoid-associated regulatory protein [unclassified Alteromonas]MEC8230013.1 H-NS family nucleoid-associated regulatory protein [Pseudomonadota bacterium]MCB4438023.1 H-NS histone family protein [Alteromonas sp. McT4-15]WDT87827.1 H-NS family nucleoid-associated regulatory protein [Alteromonas sp. 009811495]BCO18930.1 DNA-binding protein [Alteromonas sp. KC3]BCO22887.1 DNA-binding protein [Alteromonas sp. KC14]